jgi:hypothetical protein
MQVKPCYLPKLELAMADRVKVCFGVAELDPGSLPVLLDSCLILVHTTVLTPLLLVPFYAKRQRITVGLLEELGKMFWTLLGSNLSLRHSLPRARAQAWSNLDQPRGRRALFCALGTVGGL